ISTCSLEIQLEAKLRNASITGGQDLTKAGAVTRDIRRSKIRVVENIEELSPELNPHSFRDVKVFRKVEVKVDQAGAAHDADPSISKCLWRWVECRKRISVEPLLQGLRGIAQDRIDNEIWTSAPLTTDV